MGKWKRLAYWLEDWRWSVRRVWLVLKNRPLITCPFCKGDGGRMGYTDCGDEWSECGECYDHWKDLEDAGHKWVVGKMPVMKYLRARLSLWFGLWYTVRLRDMACCKIGIHQWMDDEWSMVGPGEKLCGVCYHHKRDSSPPATREGAGREGATGGAGESK